MRPSFSWCAVVLGAWLVAASPVLAQSEAPAADTPVAQIAAIREQVLYARYADAERAVTELEARTDLTPAQRNEALEIRAIILIARRRTPQANEVLQRLFSRDPNHVLIDRDAGPNVRAAFERVQAQRPAIATVTLENQTPAEIETRSSPTIAIGISEGADMVHELRVSYRNSESDDFERVIMRFDAGREVARTRLPALEGREAYQAQYFVEALAPSQAVIGTLGSELEPLAVSVPEAEETMVVSRDAEGNVLVPGGAAAGGGNIAEEWWFWTLIVAVVAGGAVGITLGLILPNQVSDGTLGSRHLILEGRW